MTSLENNLLSLAKKYPDGFTSKAVVAFMEISKSTAHKYLSKAVVDGLLSFDYISSNTGGRTRLFFLNNGTEHKREISNWIISSRNSPQEKALKKDLVDSGIQFSEYGDVLLIHNKSLEISESDVPNKKGQNEELIQETIKTSISMVTSLLSFPKGFQGELANKIIENVVQITTDYIVRIFEEQQRYENYSKV